MRNAVLSTRKPQNRLDDLSHGQMTKRLKFIHILLNLIRCTVFCGLASLIYVFGPLLILLLEEVVPDSGGKMFYGSVIILITYVVTFYLMFLLWPFKAKKVPRRLELGLRYKGFRRREDFRTRLLRYIIKSWRYAYVPSQNLKTRRVFTQCNAAYIFSKVVPKVNHELVHAERKFLSYQRRTSVFRGALRFILTIPLCIYVGVPFNILNDLFGFKEYKTQIDSFVILFGVLLSAISVFHIRPLLIIEKIKITILPLTIVYHIYLWNMICKLSLENGHDYIKKDLNGTLAEILSIEFVAISLILFQILFSFSLRKSLASLFKKEENLEKGLQSHLEECVLLLWNSILGSIKEKIQQLLDLLCALQALCLVTFVYYFLQRHRGCTSAGGLPASSEQHSLSLLSAHLSTFDGFASSFVSLANPLKRGGRNYAAA